MTQRLETGSQSVRVETAGVYPETSPQEEWNRQAQNLARLFAKELGLTEDQYVASLPKFEAQPENWRGRFDIQVIVETRVSPERMVKLLRLNPYPLANVSLIKDWETSEFKTPNTPYTAWLNDGKVNLGKSVDTVRESLESDERGATIFDGIALYLRDPEILEYYFLDFPGSQAGPDHAPFLDRLNGTWKIGLGYRSVRHVNSLCVSVVAGRQKA